MALNVMREAPKRPLKRWILTDRLQTHTGILHDYGIYSFLLQDKKVDILFLICT